MHTSRTAFRLTHNLLTLAFVAIMCFQVVMDRTWMNQIEAAMQLAVMVVVLASLSGLSAYVYRRVNKDILLPIGSVFHMIDQVSVGGIHTYIHTYMHTYIHTRIHECIRKY